MTCRVLQPLELVDGFVRGIEEERVTAVNERGDECVHTLSGKAVNCGG